MHFRHCLVLAGLVVVLSACDQPAQVPEAPIDSAELLEHIRVLSSDEFQGRAPSSPGEEKTVEYLQSGFEALGLQPGNGDSWFQEVPLVAITADPDMTLRITGAGTSMDLAYGTEMMAWTKRVVESVSLENSEMVFVGYGIVAPEYGWNDYEGVDVTGRTVVMLVNDPGFATQNPELFTGNAMTYYGRWTYKYEECARQNAAACIIVHETEPAGYPWEVVSGSWSGAQFDLRPENGNMDRAKVEGWVTTEVAQRLFEAAGTSLEEMKEYALSEDFEPRPLGLQASITIRNTLRESDSKNVIAVLPGRERPEETIVYTAHWDHLGVDSSLVDDPIYNGAVDNATGLAGLLELAEAFTALEERPARSVVFLAVTAEESGLLGSRHYTENPPFPIPLTVANLNMDAMNVYGPTSDIEVIGFGQSELDNYLEKAAAAQGRTIEAEAHPERGYYYRSDHFNFAKHGVPALYAESGDAFVGENAEQAKALQESYVSERYHKPADELLDTWNLEGMVQDLRLYFEIGLELANSNVWPEWKSGSEFKAIRDETAEMRTRPSS